MAMCNLYGFETETGNGQITETKTTKSLQYLKIKTKSFESEVNLGLK